MKIEHIKQWVPVNSSKAEKIKKIQDHGFTIPETYILTLEGNSQVDIKKLHEKIYTFLSPTKTYAVRSTNLGEDSSEKSYAGAFETFLHVNREDVADSALKVLASYGDSLNELTSSIVLIQEMVTPKFAGVLFTVDPITNSHALNVEYLLGLGDQLVQEGQEPMRAKIYKGQFVFEDASQDPHKVWLKKLAEDIPKMKKVFGEVLDLEWAYDGQEIYWLQVRPITTLPNQSIYDNKIAKNYLPGLTKPLIYDINIPLVNGAWLQIFEEIIGEIAIKPQDLAKSFYYRTYFNMGILGQLFKMVGFREDFLEKLQGINDPKLEIKFKPTKTIVKNGLKAFFFYRRSQKALQDISPLMKSYHEKSQVLKQEILNEKNVDQYKVLLDKIITHNKTGAYQKIVLPLMNIANQRKYQNYMKEKELNLGFSYYGNENAKFDPNAYLRHLSDSQNNESLLEVFTERFGHFSENNNDFSLPLWQEQPSVIHAMINASKDGKTDLNPSKESSKDDTLPLRIRKMKQKADYGISQTNQLTYYYNYSYHLFRLLFLKWGEQLVLKDILQDALDIFYLSLDDVINSSTLVSPSTMLKDQVAKEKAAYEKAKEVYLPERIIGDEEPFVSTTKAEQSTFKGVPMAPGRVKGQAFIPKSLVDLELVQPHHIVILDHSDMSYEPYLSKAKAVLIESGGVLSHIGIIARELGIPAITSLSGILEIPALAFLAVDGYSGEVILLDELDS